MGKKIWIGGNLARRSSYGLFVGSVFFFYCMEMAQFSRVTGVR